MFAVGAPRPAAALGRLGLPVVGAGPTPVCFVDGLGMGCDGKQPGVCFELLWSGEAKRIEIWGARPLCPKHCLAVGLGLKCPLSRLALPCGAEGVVHSLWKNAVSGGNGSLTVGSEGVRGVPGW